VNAAPKASPVSHKVCCNIADVRFYNPSTEQPLRAVLGNIYNFIYSKSPAITICRPRQNIDTVKRAEVVHGK